MAIDPRIGVVAAAAGVVAVSCAKDAGSRAAEVNAAESAATPATTGVTPAPTAPPATGSAGTDPDAPILLFPDIEHLVYDDTGQYLCVLRRPGAMADLRAQFS